MGRWYNLPTNLPQEINYKCIGTLPGNDHIFHPPKLTVTFEVDDDVPNFLPVWVGGDMYLCIRFLEGKNIYPPEV